MSARRMAPLRDEGKPGGTAYHAVEHDEVHLCHVDPWCVPVSAGETPDPAPVDTAAIMRMYDHEGEWCDLDIPRLCAEIDRLRAEVDRLETRECHEVGCYKHHPEVGG